jgi:hypothetical protein
MSFIKLNNYIINTRYISNIKTGKNLYRINMIANHSGVIFFGSGSFYSEDSFLDIYKDKDEDDYNKITKWIENDFKKDF